MRIAKFTRRLFTLLLTLFVVVGISGVTPPAIKNVPKAKAATYYFQTGYYMGDGSSSQPITGLGFQPQFVFLKHTSTTGVGPLWVTSQMKTDGANRTCYVSANACQGTTNYVSLNSDGFTLVSAATNAMNTAESRVTWMAAAGSDCSASGYFCVGKYTATGNAQNVTDVGFQPTFVMVKKYAAGTSVNRAAMFATDTMVAGESCQLINLNCVANEITGFLSNGFSLGAYAGGAANTNDAGGTDDNYYYVAFRDQTGIFNTGTYTVGGVEADNANITGFGNGYTPDAVWVKCRTTTTPQNGTWLTKQNYGDKGQALGDAASAVNQVQKLQDDGFQIGTADTVSIASTQYYWVGWDGAAAWPAASGTFTMKTDIYSGNSTGTSTQTISGLGFAPDLVIVKDTSTNLAFFKTKMMSDADAATGNLTQYFATNLAGLADCIRTLTSDGFIIGQSTICNSSTSTYHYMAFGNAYDPHDRSGAADFAVGCYEGNGIDNTLLINNVGFQPDMVTIKYNSTQYGVQSSSAMGADSTAYFHGAANAANFIQSFTSDGFTLGSGAPVNTTSTAAYYYWFAFKENTSTNINFDVGSYIGNGANDTNRPSSTSMVTQPDLIWVKGSSTQAGVLRPSSIGNGTDSTLYFIGGSAAVANRIDQFNALPVGFRVDNNTEVNTNLSTYYYAMWRIPVYTPSQTDWRLFDAENDTDANLDTTTGTDTTTGDAIYDESKAPTSTRIIYPGNKMKLRVKIGETENKAGTDVKYKIQYSATSGFLDAIPKYLGENNTLTEMWLYDTDNSDGYSDDQVLGINDGGGTNGYCVLSGMGGSSCGDTGSNRRGRHNEDGTTGLSAGSTFDPAAGTTYEHEFMIESSFITTPTTNTTYYFRLLFMINSNGAGAAGSWTVVPSGATVISGGTTAIQWTAATAYDLEVSAAPSTVFLGDSSGLNDINYTFSSGQKIGFWDKRGGGAGYAVNTDAFSFSGPATIPGDDITWTSSVADPPDETKMLKGAFASNRTSMTTNSPYVMKNPGKAYSAGPSVGAGGFYFQPSMDVTNLLAKSTGLYSGTLVITVV